jgi:hypothetical protein
MRPDVIVYEVGPLKPPVAARSEPQASEVHRAGERGFAA